MATKLKHSNEKYDIYLDAFNEPYWVYIDEDLTSEEREAKAFIDSYFLEGGK